MHSSGVIIGNPPYAEIPKATSRPYLLHEFVTALPNWSRDEDLYTLVVERSLDLLQPRGTFGMILPLSIAFSTKKPFVELRKALEFERGRWWWAHFDRIPCALFGNEVRTRCTISIFHRSSGAVLRCKFTTPLIRWTADQRSQLFRVLTHSEIEIGIEPGIPKVGSQLQADTLGKMLLANRPLSTDNPVSVPFSLLASVAPDFPQPCVYVGGTAYNWLPAWREVPPTTDVNGRPSLPARTACFRFRSANEANVVFALLCSSLGYWWWAVASDGFNLKKWLLDRFPISYSSLSEDGRSELSKLGKALAVALKTHYVYKDNKGRIGNYHLPSCTEEILAIDSALARHVPTLSGEVFEDIRSFNRSFARVGPSPDESGPAEEE